MQYTLDPDLDSAWSCLLKAFSETGVSLVLYGIYICLFLLSIYVLARRREAHGKQLLMAWSCVIAAGGTAQLAVTIAQAVEMAGLFANLLHGQVLNRHSTRLLTAQNALGAMNIFARDSLYLYRCYAIWEYRWKIVVLPGLCMLSIFVIGILGATTGLRYTEPQIVYGLGAATNLILTALTGEARAAGRLLWIRGTTSRYGVNNAFRARCNRAIGMVLESGAIYCIAAIFILITASINAPETYFIELGFIAQT
ncbi:hypothetical protein MSAN_02102800 [Mycena sanguinolenta]|uniref:Uncharacterized protein n=1 Tax=Mycena sanguinolenta TaxID=230812 RepID=A0A8H6XHX2_9AGAR|nr:hypothetical protein MSAN_02102800 [Mycena sanguinolenta]